jgi:20S proteasome alpha/beta subunit
MEKHFSRNGICLILPFFEFIENDYDIFRYSDQLALEDAVHTAILTLKESFEGQMTEDNIEIGICDKEGFRRLTPAEVKDYLAQIG